MTYTLDRTGANLPNGYFVPEVWSKKMQKKWYASSILPQIVNYDWEGDLKMGQTVHVRKRPDVYVKRYVSNQTLEWDNVEDSKMAITITEQFYSAHKMDEVDLSYMDINLFNEISDEIAHRHMNEEDKFVLTMAPSLAGTTLSAVNCSSTTDNLYQALPKILTALEKKYVLGGSENARPFLVIPPDVKEKLLLSSTVRFDMTGEKSQEVRYGTLPPFYGIDIFVSNFVQGAGTSGSPWQCIAGTRDAISFARKIKEVKVGVDIENGFGKGIKTLSVFGGNVTHSDALVYLPVQTTS